MEAKKITICSVGDLMLCDSPLYVSVGVGTNYPKIRKQLYSNCQDDLKSGDITIGNLESVFYIPPKNNLKERQMICPAEAITDLKKAGFNVLNVANNHCLQHGTDSFFKTISLCRDSGITAVGSKNEDICYLKIKDVTAAFLSLCLVYERYQPADIQYQDNITHVVDMIKKIKEAKENSLIIISVHWGDEFTTYPSNAQITLAHKLIEYGANIILGHHSHVFQGVEEYKNGLILYGQGNFISDMKPELCSETGITKIYAEETDVGFKLYYEIIPYKINDFIPVKNKGEWIIQRQKDLQNALENRISDDVYWENKTKNHKTCHEVFKSYFISHIKQYDLRISSQMIMEFGLRKIGKLTGSYVSGRGSSMDGKIYSQLDSIEKNY